jgi:Flp pilus assembly protein TadD
MYPHPKDRLSIATVALSGGVMILLSVLAVLTRHRWPWLWTGWFWYCIALTPVLGLVPIGLHGMADRYTDIPMIGIWIALVWTWKAVVPGYGLILGTGILAACSTCSWRQTAYWQNGASLFEHAVLANQENTLAHYNLGEALRRNGDLELALSQFERAVELAPDMTRAWTNLGGILMQQRQFSRAENAFRKAIDVQPEVAEYQFNLGTALLANNKTTAAAVALSRALELDGSLVAARQNLGVALMETGRLPQAVAVLENVDSLEKMDDDYLELLVRLQEKLSEVVFKTGKAVEADALNRRAAAIAKLLKSRHQR